MPDDSFPGGSTRATPDCSRVARIELLRIPPWEGRRQIWLEAHVMDRSKVVCEELVSSAKPFRG